MVSTAENNKDSSSNKELTRERIIRSVRTPLSFFVLVVLVVEAILGVIAGLSEGGDRTLAIIGILIIIGGLSLR